jgi:Zn-dependent peptidase ImmA (M78 family)/plasmid maintenance system antidote protein VapI
MMSAANFDPDWVSPPGETIRDALAHIQLPRETLGEALGLTEKNLRALLLGELEIDGGIARGLSVTLGGSQGFWLSRETNYRVRLNAKRVTKTAPDFDSFLKALPLNDMKAFGWLTGLTAVPLAAAALQFFEDSPGDWGRSGAQMTEAVRFRTSNAHESNPVAVAAWLRQGVLQARALECELWAPAKLADALSKIRGLTRLKAPEVFFPKLVDICSACGVAVVFVRTPKGCRASGATHFDNQRAIIQLSFRHRSDDHFWFTVFHEIGHLLLHPETPLFMEGQDYEGTEEEAEANCFAAETLIPPEQAPSLASVKRDFKAIMRLARDIGVSPGVVVGQMQNQQLIRHDQFNFLKVRYDWDTLNRINP